MIRTPLQLLSLYITVPPVTECACDAKQKEEVVKREFGLQNLEKEKLGAIYTFG